MKKKFFYKAIGLLLATAIMVTSAPSEAVAVTVDTAQPITEETGEDTLSGNDVSDIMAFDWKNATDEEITHVLGRTEWQQIGRWLRSMPEEDYKVLLSRDTILNKETTIYPAEKVDENGMVADEDVIHTLYYQYALDCFDAASQKMMLRATYPAKSSGYWTTDFVNAATGQTRTMTVKISGIDKGTKISKTQKITVAVSFTGTNWIDVTCTPKNHHLYAPSQNSGVYACAYTYFSYKKPAGYTASVSYSANTDTTKLHKIYWAPGVYGKKTSDIFDTSNYKLTDASNRKVYLQASIGDYNKSTYSGTVDLLSIVHVLANAGVGSTGDTIFAATNLKQIITLTPISYNVNYNGNGATSGTVVAQNCKYGTTYTTQNNGFARAYTITYNGNGGTPSVPNQVARYVFKGWGMNNTSTVNYVGGQSYSNLTTVSGGKVNMNAIWNGASVQLPTATRTGYQFDGWNINGIKAKAGVLYTPTAHATAVAEWKANTYKIELDSRGGTEYDSIHAVYDEELELPTPERAGYTFNGWSGESGNYNGVVKNLTTANEATVKLVAEWIPKADTQYTVQYWKQPDENVTDYAEYKLFDKAEGDAIAGKEILYGVTDSSILIPPVSVEGYETPEAQMITIKGDGSTVVNFYYNRTKSLDRIDEIAKRLAAGLSFSLDLNGAAYEIVQNADGTLGIKFTSTNESKLVIPDVVTIGDKVYRITEIYEKAFKDNTTIQEVELSSNISKIGNAAFEGCTSLKKVTLHEGLATIGNKAFLNCSSLTELKTPSTLQSIGSYAFQNCTSLKKVTFNTGLVKIGTKAFYNCSKLEKVKIPKSILQIGGYAFGNCIKLKNVSFAADCQLLTLGTGVFYGCKKMSKVALPDKLTNISGKCFYGCKAMKKVTIGKTVTKISPSAFQNCTSLAKITIPDRVQTIGKTAFYNCKKLKKVTIKSKAITQVGSKAFKKCKKGIQFIVPKSKKNAYQKLFKGKY